MSKTALSRDRFQPSRVSWPVLMALLLFLLGVPSARSQMLDLNGNGMSDVWEQIYGASGLNPDADADGDGVPNRLESLAGTNPFDSNSVPKIGLAAFLGTNFSVSIPCVLGKRYALQSAAALGGTAGTNWMTETSTVARAGTLLTLAAPAGPAAKFFRIAISDVDSDGDGLNDWEEYQLGLDPNNPYSNGQLDGNGLLINDYAYAAGRFSAPNTVTIQASNPTAVEPDPGQPALDTGTFTVTRANFPLNSITVNLGLAGPGPGHAVEGVDHAALPRWLTFPPGVSSQTVTLTPLANPNLTSPVVAVLNVLPGSGYSVGGSNSAGVVIYPSTTGNGTGLTAHYFTNSSATYSNGVNFNPTNLFLTRTDSIVDFIWYTNTTPNLSNGFYTVRWTGQVLPQYSEPYIFDVRSDDGVKLWINDQLLIDKWQTQGATDWTNSIPLVGGVRYNLRLEYLQSGGKAEVHLNWYSPSQSKQIIPANRLYPNSATPAPSAVTSPMTAVGFVGQPFSYAVTGANTPLGYTASGLPSGLAFNSTSGVINGIPNLAGDYQVLLSSSNAFGLGASVLNLEIFSTGSAVSREVWTNSAGVNISDIPVNSPANLTNSLGTLEGTTDYGDNYAERIRGYLTAPATGNYYFWIAGSDSAEFWLSNDSEPVNKVRRAYVLPSANPAPPPTNGTASRQWNLQPTQKSGWLSLVAGQRYYFEILHKAGAGAGDNWSVGWLQDPAGTNALPAGIVPGYVLSRYFPPPLVLIPGTLYSANLLAQGNVSTAVGSATLRLSADGSQAVLKFSYSGLSSPVTGEHIHCDPYLNHPSQIMFDIDAAAPQPDGSYVWNIGPVGTLSAADVAEIIREGKSYINIHTVNFPAGEINGHFTAADGSQTFTPPPPPPAWTDDSADPNAAARFLIQATFGPSPADIAAVQTLGYTNWINQQFSLPATHHLPVVQALQSPDPSDPFPSSLTFNTWWQQSVTAPDQLRQRVAFALSEILVVSENGVLQNNAAALSSYYDVLLDHAFGNFRSLLKAVTLAPAMGLYLDLLGNDAGSIITGVHANENYAREIQQLFSIGLNRLWPDGTLVLNSQGALVPTYDQSVVMGFASVFTGWNYFQPNQGNGRLPVNWYPSANDTNSMALVPTHHELGAKRLLDNVVLPPASGSQADPASTNFDNFGSQDLESALDSIFYNQNVGPFICRQLIQRLVTSNPSRGYLYRVVEAFNDNGSGVRGDLQAVIKAILLDYEARSSNLISQATYGKQREPLLRATAPARAFLSPPPIGGTYGQNGSEVVSIATTNAHRLNTGDTVLLNFTDTSGNPAPPFQGYKVTVITPTSFTVTAPGLAVGTYSQTGTTITVTNANHGLLAGFSVYLVFTTGGAASGAYPVTTVPTNSQFTVTAPDSATRSGNCLFPKLTGGGYVVQNHTNVTVSTALPHGLLVGDNVYLNFSAAGSPPDGQYQVVSVPDPTHFTVLVPSSNNQTQNGLTEYPLAAPALVRSGTVTAQFSTWNMGYTDTGGSSSLSQTPIRSPTVFNFFYPDYEFPGPLASAGLTTPEFQLTSDSSVAEQMNFMEGALLNNTGNTNGLSSFAGGNGAIVLDLGPWMTPAYTADNGIPALVDALNSLLCAGQLSAGAKTAIVNYVANTNNFAYTTPTATQMRDRVRAVAHLIVSSPDFIIEK